MIGDHPQRVRVGLEGRGELLGQLELPQDAADRVILERRDVLQRPGFDRRRRIGRLAGLIVACDALSQWCAGLLDQGYRGEMECIVAKIFGSEAQKEAAIELFMKTHGGRSFLHGHLFGDNVHEFLAPCIYEGEGEIDHLPEIGADPAGRVAAQAVVAAEFDDDYTGPMYLERARQAAQSIARRIAADAGIHHRVPVTFCDQAVLQQGNPGLPGIEAVPGAQTVADDQDPGVRGDRAVGGCRQAGEAGIGAGENGTGKAGAAQQCRKYNWSAHGGEIPGDVVAWGMASLPSVAIIEKRDGRFT